MDTPSNEPGPLHLAPGAGDGATAPVVPDSGPVVTTSPGSAPLSLILGGFLASCCRRGQGSFLLLARVSASQQTGRPRGPGISSTGSARSCQARSACSLVSASS